MMIGMVMIDDDNILITDMIPSDGVIHNIAKVFLL